MLINLLLVEGPQNLYYLVVWTICTGASYWCAIFPPCLFFRLWDVFFLLGRKSWEIWIPFSSWWSHLFRFTWPTIAPFIPKCPISNSKGVVLLGLDQHYVEIFFFLSWLKFVIYIKSHLQNDLLLITCNILFLPLCCLLIIGIRIYYVQRAGLFPNYDLLYMYSRLNLKSGLYQILVSSYFKLPYMPFLSYIEVYFIIHKDKYH